MALNIKQATSNMTSVIFFINTHFYRRSKPNDRHESRERRSAHSRSSGSKHRDRSRERRR